MSGRGELVLAGGHVPAGWRASAEVERTLLGGVLRQSEGLAEVAPLLRDDDFHSDAHQRIWRAIVAVWETRRPLDLVAVAEELIHRDHLADCGGAGYLAEVFDAGAGGNLDYYAAQVRGYATLRRLAAAGRRVVELAENPTGDAAEQVAAAEAAVLAVAARGDVRPLHTLGELAAVVVDDVDRRTALPPGERLTTGVPTALTALDELTGGWQPSSLNLLAARPSIGKTALALHLTAAAAAAGRGVLFASLEQAGGELAERFLAARTGLDATALRRAHLSPPECEMLLDATRLAESWPVWVDDEPRQTVTHIAARARRLAAAGKLGLIVVDYLQLVEPDDRRAPRHEQVAQTSRRLKQLARELRLPVLALAQLNRQLEDRGAAARPRLSDLRESGSLEQDADVVLLLHRPVDTPKLLEVLIAKQRNGPTGEVIARFDRATCSFTDAEPGDAAPVASPF